MAPFDLPTIVAIVAIFFVSETISSPAMATWNRKRQHPNRFKRDFMYVSGLNSTDAGCFQVPKEGEGRARGGGGGGGGGGRSKFLFLFQKCNDDWNRSFNAQFNLSATDFYDFPLHPAILDHAGYLSYCQIAEAKTRCYMDQCDDHVRRTHFK